MREILFRGKSVKGIWVYGYYFAKPILEKHYIEIGEEQFLVIPETVGQYTGLKDKNGKRIFEGDIVRKKIDVYPAWEEYPSGEHIIFGVVILDKNYGYVVRAKNENGHTIDYALNEEFEVIGNVYDNTELTEANE